MTDASLARRDVTLLDLVDSILQRGTALSGDLVLSVADVDLVQVNLRALLGSVDTVERLRSSSGGLRCPIDTGHTQFTTIPYCPHSRAAERVSERMASFDELYGA